MDREMIERLAREADFEVTPSGGVLSLSQDERITLRLGRFAALIVDECIKAAESNFAAYDAGVGDVIRAKFKGG